MRLWGWGLAPCWGLGPPRRGGCQRMRHGAGSGFNAPEQSSSSSLADTSTTSTPPCLSPSLNAVSAISSKLNEVHTEKKLNFSNRDSLCKSRELPRPTALYPPFALSLSWHLYRQGSRRAGWSTEAREWEYFDGKCYYFSIDRMSWYKAKTQCEEMHSRLAIINSFTKQNFVMFRTRNERFWIGLTDGNSEGEWEWIDGTDYKSTFWKEGEPNNSGNNEDCAHVWTSGQWNDVYCTFECYYLCEKPVPH
uniref:C-type lectin domain-containing protein n=1 Tax=Anser cygnoides TaxID=8845 RepID=A0A8B9DQA8_ANSCY